MDGQPKKGEDAGAAESIHEVRFGNLRESVASGERTLPACWFRYPAETNFIVTMPNTTMINRTQARFEKNMARHCGLEWAKVKARLDAYPEKL
jgi:hypothetical protein